MRKTLRPRNAKTDGNGVGNGHRSGHKTGDGYGCSYQGDIFTGNGRSDLFKIKPDPFKKTDVITLLGQLPDA